MVFSLLETLVEVALAWTALLELKLALNLHSLLAMMRCTLVSFSALSKASVFEKSTKPMKGDLGGASILTWMYPISMS